MKPASLGQTTRELWGKYCLSVSSVSWAFMSPSDPGTGYTLPRTGMTSGKDRRSSSKERTVGGSVLATLPIGGQQSSLMEDSGHTSV